MTRATMGLVPNAHQAIHVSGATILFICTQLLTSKQSEANLDAQCHRPGIQLLLMGLIV